MEPHCRAYFLRRTRASVQGFDSTAGRCSARGSGPGDVPHRSRVHAPFPRVASVLGFGGCLAVHGDGASCTWHTKSLRAPRRGCCEVHAPVRPRARTPAWLSASVRATVVTKARGHELSRFAHMLGTRVCRTCAFGGVVSFWYGRRAHSQTMLHIKLLPFSPTRRLWRAAVMRP